MNYFVPAVQAQRKSKTIPNCFSIGAALPLWLDGSFLGYDCAVDHRNRSSKVVWMTKARGASPNGMTTARGTPLRCWKLKVAAHLTTVWGSTVVPTVAV